MSVLQLIIHFSLGFITSFIGSIPFGSINITVARISVLGEKTSAIRFILGATVAELFYGAVSIHFSAFLLTIPNLKFYIQLVSIPIFILLGCSYFFSKPKSENLSSNVLQKNYFLQGLTIGFLNPLQIPFWLAYGTYFLSVGWIREDIILLNSFILGIISGSFVLLLLIAKFASHYRSKFSIDELKINKIIGGIFMLLAIYQGLLLI